MEKINNSIINFAPPPDGELKVEIKDLSQKNLEFVLSLDERQRDYYLNLTKSWRKHMVELESRVHDLEQKAKSD